ncbi:branched-chain amino acid ABC transporter permease [Halomicrobium urmianum]|uniref:branched-chain amino acid ABC transporter permease n=1 Tax=Halomicrobium urmianum TaxID=1586233 RepID=UPI001CD97E81|nr:branched-chain amino acid ABC transporter permease [Halomicrobium urmianum]
MGITETVHDGRGAVAERPAAALVGVVAGYLLLDLLVKLAGTSVFFMGVKVIGGALTISSLASMALDGLLVGLAVGLAGIGLSMTYSILDFANFAHGDTVTAGAFVGWVAAYVAAGIGTGASLADLVMFDTGQQLSVTLTPVAVLVGLVVAAAGTVAVALLIDRLAYRPMRDAGSISLLIASIGVALALRYVVAFLFGTQSSGVASQGFRLILLNPAGQQPVAITDNELALLAISLALMLGIHLLLQRTKLGKAMRAMADNEDLARVTGIPTERVIRLTWILGGALAGVAGYLLVLESGTISFNFGWILLLLIFAAVILGGIGSIYGAMAGGVVIGLVDSMALIWLPSGLTRAAAFLALIVVLLVRPEGIFGGVTTA